MESVARKRVLGSQVRMVLTDTCQERLRGENRPFNSQILALAFHQSQQIHKKLALGRQPLLLELRLLRCR